MGAGVGWPQSRSAWWSRPGRTAQARQLEAASETLNLELSERVADLEQQACGERESLGDASHQEAELWFAIEDSPEGPEREQLRNDREAELAELRVTATACEHSVVSSPLSRSEPITPTLARWGRPPVQGRARRDAPARAGAHARGHRARTGVRAARLPRAEGRRRRTRAHRPASGTRDARRRTGPLLTGTRGVEPAASLPATRRPSLKRPRRFKPWHIPPGPCSGTRRQQCLNRQTSPGIDGIRDDSGHPVTT